MQNRALNRAFRNAALAFSLGIAALGPAQSCTRAVYLGTDGTVITGRSMDWSEDMASNLWAFPRGIKREGAAGPKSLTWVSKYGSVVVSSYEAGTADGMNEAGLVANLLYLAESDLANPKATNRGYPSRRGRNTAGPVSHRRRSGGGVGPGAVLGDRTNAAERPAGAASSVDLRRHRRFWRSSSISPASSSSTTASDTR